MSAAAFLEEIAIKAWAMDGKSLAAFAELARKASAEATPPEAFLAFMGERMAKPEPLYQLKGSTAVVKVSGVLVQKKPAWFSWYGVDATETGRIKTAVEAAAADPACGSICLHVSSPGGEAQGVHDVAAAIRSVGKSKPVECVVEGLCASGAYWVASAARSVSAGKDAFVGSIGVYQVVADYSKMAADMGVKVHVVRSGDLKGQGVFGAEISEKHIAATQELVDGFAKLFKSSVKKGRGKALEDVDAVATGQLWMASTAKKKGLVDRIESAERALSRYEPEDGDDQDYEDEEDDSMAKNGKTTPGAGEPEENQAEKAVASERERVAAIKGAFPKDPAFALEQIEKGSTLEQARGEYSTVLEQRLAAKDEELAKVRAEKPTEPKAAPRAATPVPFAGSADAGSRPQQDFVALAKEKAKAEKIPYRVAASAIAKEDPNLHRDFVEAQGLVKKNPDRRSYDRTTRQPNG